MYMKKMIWDDIPSLDDLEIDWDFRPENPLGKRTWPRVAKNELQSFLEVKNIRVKVVSRNFDHTGFLLDLSRGGSAVLLDTKPVDNQLVKIGFFLGKHKVLAKAIVRNVCPCQGKYRVGMEFVDLTVKDISFIAGLISSKGYGMLA